MQKHPTRLEDFEDKILTLYARGMTTKDIQVHVQDFFGVEVSPTFISTLTEAAMDEVRQWQNRPITAVYPIVFVDWISRQRARESACEEFGSIFGSLRRYGGATGSD